MYLLTVLDGTGRTLVRPIDGPTSIDSFRAPWRDEHTPAAAVSAHLVRGRALVHTTEFQCSLAELRPGQRATIGDVTALLTRAG